MAWIVVEALLFPRTPESPIPCVGRRGRLNTDTHPEAYIISGFIMISLRLVMVTENRKDSQVKRIEFFPKDLQLKP